jgi:hypothetical protein
MGGKALQLVLSQLLGKFCFAQLPGMLWSLALLGVVLFSFVQLCIALLCFAEPGFALLRFAELSSTSLGLA